MALSSNHRNLLKGRTYSPVQYLLSPNDDASERARARAERAAAQRRKFLPADSATESPQEESNLLDEEVVAGLLESCLKLAAENKINQQNTWELPLIDHLSEVFKNNDNQDAQCNFQKASCGLEAGVKIYATRVDSVHSQAFRVLGGITRGSNLENGADASEDAQETAEDVEGGAQSPKEKCAKKGDSTLAPSFESLTVKKFDLAFDVDPLFKLTSAQFDEGGARGLLLNALSVYRHCELAFDSLYVPEQRMKAEPLPEPAGTATVDLSFMKDTISEMMQGISECPVLTPTLKEILSGLDDPARAVAEAEAEVSTQNTVPGNTWAPCPNSCFDDDPYTELRNNSFPETLHQTGYDMNADMADSFSVEDDDIPSLSPVSGSVNGDDGASVYDEVDSATGQEDDNTFGWLLGQKGQDPKSNAWAGSDHWKFHKADEASKTEADSKNIEKPKRKSKKQPEQFVVDFGDADRSRFVTPKDLTVTTKRYNFRASTLAQQCRADSLNLLPEDCHYQALDLVQLFLRPVVRTPRKSRRRTGGLRRDQYTCGSTVGDIWDEVDSFGAGEADEWRHGSNSQSDVEDSSAFDWVPEPRKVQKVSVNYERTSKQVDVHRLKETMWDHLRKAPVAREDSYQDAQGSTSSSTSGEGLQCSFQEVLERLSDDAPDTLSSASVALCLICLLHLANEHGLIIQHSPSLDEVIIRG